ncbi:zinc ribbon domain-containing protein [Shewanella xiamenensis]|uniref:zinc ribbon domain-containing protein n=1 Tax=Shewanella xiamenensis TaxID=332186 RepID=UPI00217EECB3|nr:zinc ribbon domain-containing protein [Shewanella xiamenensis]MCT8858317.1 zinc ribbon domain-containing protein [Shewanella xiamenensis]UWG65863.1 zinc ribbon domain-containing protein [Shewanella xiamenensis]
MALVKCKECGKEVSETANTCPHCGAKNPGITPAKVGKGCLGVFVFALIISTVIYLSEDKLKLNNFISKLETQLNNKPATVFSFGGDNENFCSVSVNHDFFKSQNGEFSNVRRNELQFDMSCNTLGNYYVISSNHDTYAKVKFYGRSETPKTIYANIDAKLTTPDGDYLFVSGSDIAVSLHEDSDTKAVEKSEQLNESDDVHVFSDPKFNEFKGFTDCKLARLIVKDYMPLMMSLGQLIESKPTYQQANEWKINSNFDAKISQIESKYPRHYNVYFTNAQLAAGLNVRVGQLWREVFFSLRSTDNNGPIKSDQWSMVESELNQIMTSCKAEFDK